jgi:hypothetical protein
MFFYREEAGCKLYDPFEPLMKDFTSKSGKPLAFFFELIKGESSSDNHHWCGYAIFNGDVSCDEKSYPVGSGKKIKNQLADWLGDKGIKVDDDAVDEEWQYQVQCQLEDIYRVSRLLEDVDEEYRTLEICLAALSKVDDPDFLEEQMEYVPDDLKEQVRTILQSGEGCTEAELFEKVQHYTAKDMRD